MKICTLCVHKLASNSTTQTISFEHYNPNKPVRYGLLLKAIDAPCCPYTFIAAPRCGKPVEDPGEYYVFGTFEVVKEKVDHFESIVTLAGRNISFDRLYTSIPLAFRLYQKIFFLLKPCRSTGREFLLK